MSRVLFSDWFRSQCIIKTVQGIIQRLVQHSAYYLKMSRVLFSVWFRILRIIQKCPGYYSASGLGFSVLLKMSRVLFSVRFRIQGIIKKCPGYYSASGPGFSVLFKNVQDIIQRPIQYSAYYSKMSRVLFSVWFRIQRIIKKYPGYYSVSGSVFSVLLKNVQGLISDGFRI